LKNKLPELNGTLENILEKTHDRAINNSPEACTATFRGVD
jgi:hypothetical protein